jgi:hypothetical protein
MVCTHLGWLTLRHLHICILADLMSQPWRKLRWDNGLGRDDVDSGEPRACCWLLSCLRNSRLSWILGYRLILGRYWRLTSYRRLLRCRRCLGCLRLQRLRSCRCIVRKEMEREGVTHQDLPTSNPPLEGGRARDRGKRLEGRSTCAETTLDGFR